MAQYTIGPIKTCKKCNMDKPVTAFHIDRSYKDGRFSSCKKCRKAATDTSYKADWYQDNSDRLKQLMWERNLKRNYGISASMYDSMLDEQNGGCAMCGETQSTRLAVDHCHQTGIVRGLLCNSCNTAIGLLKDSPELCEAAATYLRIANGI